MSSIHSDVYVTATGPALSRLLFENANRSGSQVGFLVGSVLRQRTDTISDSEMSNKKTETSINIDSIVPISSFCDNIGRIDRKKIMECLKSSGHQNESKDHLKDGFVGWYCYNRSTFHHFSMREFVIHLQLSEIAHSLSKDNDPEHFIFCLLSSSVNKATHAFKHSCMRFVQQRKSFEVVPMQILNLGTSQQLQYQVRACPPKSASRQKELLQSAGQGSTGKDCLLEVQKAIQEKLAQNASKLYQKDKKVLRLQEEVQELRNTLMLKLQQRDAKKKNELTRKHSRKFVDNSFASVEEHHDLTAPRSPNENISAPTGVRDPTSPVFLKQNYGRGGRGRATRTTASDGE